MLTADPVTEPLGTPARPPHGRAPRVRDVADRVRDVGDIKALRAALGPFLASRLMVILIGVAAPLFVADHVTRRIPIGSGRVRRDGATMTQGRPADLKQDSCRGTHAR